MELSPNLYFQAVTWVSLCIPGFATVAISVLIIISKKLHGKHSFDSHTGVQKVHVAPTPRIGGIAIISGLLAAWFLAPDPVSKQLGLMLISGLPAFAAGLTEDFTKRVTIRNRLLATMVSALLAWWLTGYNLNDIDISPIDYFLAYVPLSVAFTAVAVGGVVNSINIIDGFNGLAAGTLMICFSALGFIAWQVGDAELARLCVVFIAVAAGFLVVNFPFGKIFMGDGGAYLLGFMLAWVSVMLPFRNHEVSAWAPLLICAHPILETVFSMMRRYNRSGQHPGQADSLHLHSLLYSRVARNLLPNAKPQFKNSLTSLFLWPISLVCSLASTVWFSNTVVLMVGFVVCAFSYHLIYLRLTQFVWCLRPATISRD